MMKKIWNKKEILFEIEEQVPNSGAGRSGTSRWDDSLDRINTIMEKAFTETVKEKLGLKKRKTKPWISQTAWDLIDQRKNIKQKMDSARSERLKQQQRDDYREKDKEVKKQIKKDKKEWMENMAKEAEDAARHQNMRAFYGLTKELSNERP